MKNKIEKNEEKFIELLKDVKSEFNEQLTPGLKKGKVELKKTKKLERFMKILEKDPSFIEKSKAYKAFYNDEEFKRAFENVIIRAGVNETDTASYVFDDGSVLKVSISTEKVETEPKIIGDSDMDISINSTTTEPSTNGTYISTYEVDVSWAWLDNGMTVTEAKWYNGGNYADVKWSNAYLDVSPGTGSASSYIRDDNSNPGIVRGQFQINDPFGKTTVTKITELSLWPGNIPLAGGEVIR